jgi:cold shock CspA family protein
MTTGKIKRLPECGYGFASTGDDEKSNVFIHRSDVINNKCRI